MNQKPLFVLYPSIVLFLVGILLAGSQPLVAQSIPKKFSLGRTTDGNDDRPISNSAIEFLMKQDSVWAGTGKGIDLTVNGGRSWKHFANTPPFQEEDVAAISNHENTIWISLAGSLRVDDQILPEGKGLAFSTDNGATWTKIPQPKEPDGDSVRILTYGVNKIRALAVTTTVNNISYDIAVTKNAVWTANFAAGLRRSTDLGKTWEMMILPPDFKDAIKPTDTLDFDLSPVTNPKLRVRENYNHRVFSVMATNDSTIWVGTAAGINLTTDNGVSWKHFTYSNQAQPISGNFVVALGRNKYQGKDLIWASTVNAIDAREYRAVSVSADTGKSWSTSLRGEFCHNFGFKDSIGYTVSNSGLFRSDDAGRSWVAYSNFTDAKTKRRISDPSCYAVDSQRDTIWVATADGIIKSTDSKDIFLGTDWTIFRAYQTSPTASDVYVYPNPFSPAGGVTRVHYALEGGTTASIKVFNFAMEPVRTLINKAPRSANMQHDEIWDGKNDDGKIVANGVYYVRVQIDENDPAWGKVIVLQ